MYLYQNSSFFKRFFSSIFDTMISIIVCVFLFFLIGKFTDLRYVDFNKIQYYSIFILIIIFLIFYYIFIPYFLNGSTLGMLIFKMKIIHENKDRRLNLMDLVKRNILLYIVIFNLLYIIVFFNNESIKLFKLNDEQIKNLSFIDKTKINFSYAFTSVFMFVSFINFAVLLLNKKKLSALEYISSTRVVNKKMVYIHQNENIKLMPIQIEEREIILYIND
ncbi:hypothetical protein HUN03_00175 [Mycoplasmopsis anatis]|uniref:RDD domain-containing protein n=1 Tax=Mycoplasmopsis anatis TaxID=171279 RepID=A0A9Q3QE46_9BACT|nr:RDD family protein [Mycoplasmopsis anatis]MBW0594583.1 hypothetical protein [Mycoplasmopsis anatis]MBW0595363.1 hypothetical protein [Mycoplasmopsis anatis]MBW0596270.1 hypothetical protein [Mycoplasmopsis anatis]MBW0597010.1 hypothetical protein [Mycoplasmopsis anatis]MBW0597302.1 hypothetical protein [Mycoplasmopsis anatis]